MNAYDTWNIWRAGYLEEWRSVEARVRGPGMAAPALAQVIRMAARETGIDRKAQGPGSGGQVARGHTEGLA